MSRINIYLFLVGYGFNEFIIVLKKLVTNLFENVTNLLFLITKLLCEVCYNEVGL